MTPTDTAGDGTAAPTAVSPLGTATLAVFFSRGMSLEGWRRAGILEREMALYMELARVIGSVMFVTYGGAADLELGRAFPHVEVLPNRWGLPSNVYSVLAPWLHRARLRRATLFKTNQLNGAWTAVIAKAAFGTPLVVRCGFLWADFVARLTSSRLRRWVARALEGLAVRSADRVVVAAAADAARIIDRYHVDPARVTVIPNYVDTARFRPDDGVVPDAGHILFVGRLEDQKNPALLIDAARTVPGVHITVVGDGPLRADLESLAQANGVAVHFAGRLAHDALAGLFRRAQVFVLPSRYEGNPKVLVEAMACGVPVVGTRVPGIADVIADRQNGLLCDSSVESLRAAIVELLRDAGLRTRLANAGRRYVEAHCSLGAAVASERALLEGITSS